MPAVSASLPAMSGSPLLPCEKGKPPEQHPVHQAQEGGQESGSGYFGNKAQGKRLTYSTGKQLHPRKMGTPYTNYLLKAIFGGNRRIVE